jgi:hypothetical protein
MAALDGYWKYEGSLPQPVVTTLRPAPKMCVPTSKIWMRNLRLELTSFSSFPGDFMPLLRSPNSNGVPNMES